MPGPPPTPTSILEARGSRRAGLGRNEPSPPPKIPTAPEFLSTRAKTEWRRLTKALLAQGLLTDLDRTILALHCNALADYVHWRKTVEDEKLAKGPEVARMNEAAKMLVHTGGLFGLSPSSRRSLAIACGPPKKRDPRGRKQARGREILKFSRGRA